MSHRIMWAAVVVCSAALAVAGPKGTVPRATIERYTIHTVRDGVGVGVILLSREQVRKSFVSDVDRCCVVAEIALYPAKDKALEVSLNDFAMRVSGTDTATKPASAKLVATSLQRKAGSGRDITVSPTVGVGYESAGYDPVTGGRTSGGMTRSAGVMVGVGGGGPKAGSTDKDRAAMEIELSEKGLPEGSVSTPVSGYVYFPLASRKKGAPLQMEYILNGNKVVLNLPQ
ncbi:MAG: hypothetical protein LAO56_23535 [Acidobacteriia bacterium]|nr:hypothetical protein [Terriglobia bacterium]